MRAGEGNTGEGNTGEGDTGEGNTSEGDTGVGDIGEGYTMYGRVHCMHDSKTAQCSWRLLGGNV